MSMVRNLAFVALAALSVASFGSRASAQDAARDAAIHKCMTEAQARYPNASEETTMRARTDVYRSCMRTAGLNP
jgi:hypothetical protein